MRVDWKGSVVPAVRTAGALVTGNAFVWFALDPTRIVNTLAMVGIGLTMIVVTSFTTRKD
jgi:hypothetical protein